MSLEPKRLCWAAPFQNLPLQTLNVHPSPTPSLAWVWVDGQGSCRVPVGVEAGRWAGKWLGWGTRLCLCWGKSAQSLLSLSCAGRGSSQASHTGTRHRRRRRWKGSLVLPLTLAELTGPSFPFGGCCCMGSEVQARPCQRLCCGISNNTLQSWLPTDRVVLAWLHSFPFLLQH